MTVITGKSERAARMLLARIKQAYNKLMHHSVTITELCSYLGISKVKE